MSNLESKLRKMVMARARMAERWFGITDLDEIVKRVDDDPTMQTILETREATDFFRKYMVRRILEGDRAFIEKLPRKIVDAVLAGAEKWKRLHGDKPDGAA